MVLNTQTQGVEIFDDIKKIETKKEGVSSVILAGVHGNEIAPVKILEKTLQELSIENGTLYYGYGNPKAIYENKRYIDDNLNRLFYDGNISEKTLNAYEFGRMQLLKKYFDKSDILLDLHTSSIKNSMPFIICEPNAYEIIKYIPVEYVVSGFDKHEPGGTDYYMNKSKKIGICVECGYLDSAESENIARLSIVSFLSAIGQIDEQNLKPKPKKYFRVFYKHYAQNEKFTLSKQFENFETVQKGQTIGFDGQQHITTPKESAVLFAHNGTRFDEVFLLAEKITL